MPTTERSRRAILRVARPASDGGVRGTAAFSVLVDEWPAVKTQLQTRLDQ